MLAEDTIRDILTTPTFGKQAQTLACHLHEPLEDASQDLIVELLDHRLKSWADEDVEDAVVRELPELQWRITFARKDVERRTWHDERVEKDKVEMLGLTIPPDTHSEAELNGAIERANSILHNHMSQEWVESVLRYGKRETMARFGQSNRQFSTKLHKMTLYLTTHRKDADTDER
ncbi:hypothetical protein LH991_14140 [Schleiferilactobacillus harbinensis]|uniref:hypothetical protein n=1 Tax=Schleiferilactobacillus harbinensis TaxID=304207 RepID=UPI000683E297|nr:hypothetical protein [Schleiferilactobacillus harbinensis]QFR65004.1 hypothetical protein LH991_14140 [Schleiferilactobacillus harbinensis]